MQWERDRPRGRILGTAPGFTYEVRACPDGWRYERVMSPNSPGHLGPLCPTAEEAAATAEVNWRLVRDHRPGADAGRHATSR
jgi:hypothetical protein